MRFKVLFSEAEGAYPNSPDSKNAVRLVFAHLALTVVSLGIALALGRLWARSHDRRDYGALLDGGGGFWHDDCLGFDASGASRIPLFAAVSACH